jgi:hypothetical protein
MWRGTCVWLHQYLRLVVPYGIPTFGFPFEDVAACIHLPSLEDSLGRSIVISSSRHPEAVERGRRRRRAVLPPNEAASCQIR